MLVNSVLPFSPTMVRHYVGTRRIRLGISLQLHTIINNTAPSTPFYHQSDHHYTIFENSGIFATAKGVFSLRSPLAKSVCGTLFVNFILLATRLRLFTLSHSTDPIPSLVSILRSPPALFGSQSSMDILFYPFEGWCIRSVSIIVWD